MSVLAWGLGKSGQLGNAEVKNSELPCKVTIIGEAIVICTGALYTLVLLKGGEVYAFGCGKHGRLGTGKEDDATTPVRVHDLPRDITTISCGSWHGCALDGAGRLYSWGYSRSHGVLGVECSSSLSPPRLVSSLSSIKVTGVSCGNNFTLAWSDNGVAFSWGCGRHGVLGHADEQDRLIPTRVETLGACHVSKMAAGFAHCGAVLVGGEVYMFGQNKDGALGLGSTKLKLYNVPTQISSIKENPHIVGLSCSVGEHHGHTLACTNKGVVFAWGDGYKGKLGLGNQESKFVPTPIPREYFQGESIISVSAGGIHSAAVSQEGHVFTWGCGSDGRLGHPEAKGHRYLFRSDVPRVVEDVARQGKAIAACASYYHTAALLQK